MTIRLKSRKRFFLGIILVLLTTKTGWCDSSFENNEQLQQLLLKEDWGAVIQFIDTNAISNPVAGFLKGHAYLATNRNNESIAQFSAYSAGGPSLRDWSSWTREFRKKNSRYPIAYYLEGDALARLTNYDAARSTFLQGLDKQKDHSLINNAIGVVYAMKQQWDEALDSFNTAVAIKPDFADAYANLAALTLDQHETMRSAVEDFNQALKHSPDFVIAEYSLGNVYAALGEWENARRYVGQAFEESGTIQWMLEKNFSALSDRIQKQEEQGAPSTEKNNPQMLIEVQLEKIKNRPPSELKQPIKQLINTLSASNNPRLTENAIDQLSKISDQQPIKKTFIQQQVRNIQETQKFIQDFNPAGRSRMTNDSLSSQRVGGGSELNSYQRFLIDRRENLIDENELLNQEQLQIQEGVKFSHHFYMAKSYLDVLGDVKNVVGHFSTDDIEVLTKVKAKPYGDNVGPLGPSGPPSWFSTTDNMAKKSYYDVYEMQEVGEDGLSNLAIKKAGVQVLKDHAEEQIEEYGPKPIRLLLNLKNADLLDKMGDDAFNYMTNYAPQRSQQIQYKIQENNYKIRETNQQMRNAGIKEYRVKQSTSIHYDAGHNRTVKSHNKSTFTNIQYNSASISEALKRITPANDNALRYQKTDNVGNTKYDQYTFSSRPAMYSQQSMDAPKQRLDDIEVKKFGRKADTLSMPSQFPPPSPPGSSSVAEHSARSSYNSSFSSPSKFNDHHNVVVDQFSQRFSGTESVPKPQGFKTDPEGALMDADDWAFQPIYGLLYQDSLPQHNDVISD